MAKEKKKIDKQGAAVKRLLECDGLDDLAGYLKCNEREIIEGVGIHDKMREPFYAAIRLCEERGQSPKPLLALLRGSFGSGDIAAAIALLDELILASDWAALKGSSDKQELSAPMTYAPRSKDAKAVVEQLEKGLDNKAIEKKTWVKQPAIRKIAERWRNGGGQQKA